MSQEPHSSAISAPNEGNVAGQAARKPIPYGRQTISEEDIDAVAAVLRSDFLTQGPAVAAFETAFADYIGAKHAIAVANGTAALHLCALALNVQPGTKVITTPITFAASANCVRYCGGEIDFVDIDPATGVMDLNALQRKLTSAPAGTYSGVIPVDFAGYPVDLEKVRAIADQHKLWIIEDACHAPGGSFIDSSGTSQNCGNGNFAELAIFSFHPVKHIACGEGGMITTNDAALAERIAMLRTHGISKDPNQLSKSDGGWYYEMLELGYNYRLSDMQAALGYSQLKKADAGIARRKEIAARYDRAFANTSVTSVGNGNQGHAYHLYVVKVLNRKAVYDRLRKNNIFAQVHYIPVHTLPYYAQLGWNVGDLPQAETYYAGALSLPMFPALTNEEQDFVIETVLNASAGGS